MQELDDYDKHWSYGIFLFLRNFLVGFTVTGIFILLAILIAYLLGIIS